MVKRLAALALIVLAGCSPGPGVSSDSGLKGHAGQTVTTGTASPVPVDSSSPPLLSQDDEARAGLKACGVNLKTLGTALELYSTDWSGTYPPTETGLAALTPNYLRTMPECPSAQQNTYSYSHGKNVKQNTYGFQDYFLLRCTGGHHTVLGLEADEPAYDNVVGLLTDVEPDRASSPAKSNPPETSRSAFERCCDNLKRTGTALEMYSTDWSAKYPPDLGHLIPEYLESMPECPVSGRSYEARFGPKAPGNTAAFQDYYFLACPGETHKEDGVPAGFPQYNGISGIVSGKAP